MPPADPVLDEVYGEAVRDFADALEELWGLPDRAIPWPLMTYASAALARRLVPEIRSPLWTHIFPICPYHIRIQPASAQEREALAWWIFHEELEARAVQPGIGSGYYARGSFGPEGFEIYRSLALSLEPALLPTRPNPWRREPARSRSLRKILAHLADAEHEPDREVELLSGGLSTRAGVEDFVDCLVHQGHIARAGRVIVEAKKHLHGNAGSRLEWRLGELGLAGIDLDPFERDCRIFEKKPAYHNAHIAWDTAVASAKVPEFLQRAWPFLDECLRRGAPAGLSRQDIQVSIVAVSLLSGDLRILETLWELNSRQEPLWHYIHITLLREGGSAIRLMAHRAVDLGLDYLAPERWRPLRRMLQLFCEEVGRFSPTEKLLEWRDKFLIRHAETPEFTEMIRSAIRDRS